MSMFPDDHICPECREGKCSNCKGDAWCLIEDGSVKCSCTHGDAA